MSSITVQHSQINELFSLNHADHGFLKSKTEEGFVVSKRFPGVAWIKAAFNSKTRRENRAVRREFVARLHQIASNKEERDSFIKSPDAIRRIASKISIDSGAPLSRKYLFKLSTTLMKERAAEKGKEAKGNYTKLMVVYRLFGQKAAVAYANYQKRALRGDLNRNDEPSAFKNLFKPSKPKIDSDLQEWMERNATNN